MNPVNAATRVIAELLADDRWAIAHGFQDGCPRILRYRDAISQELGRSEHQHLVLIRWSYPEAEGKEGLPSTTSLDEMSQFEDALLAAVERPLADVLVSAVTGQGQRIWALYVRSPTAFSEKFRDVHAPGDGYPIEVGIWMDPDWGYFFNEILGAID
ncbi:DUF695 domain-containing protein [Stenotrophomonas maltophilia]|uniref:DUF695 domain-containing protein n=1 Tax=Stenotrophomonas maltophilia TaxID=40324 RepID=UPI0021C6F4E3|nr:DUF695 domain-containing protein [Stenotrophomonas maltophilia]MCU1134693.1 DUF695 domain-containing protein [Stenotrophomonas maltophilia]